MTIKTKIRGCEFYITGIDGELTSVQLINDDTNIIDLCRPEEIAQMQHELTIKELQS